MLHLATKYADSRIVAILQQANITWDPDARDTAGLNAQDLILQRSRERPSETTEVVQSLIQLLSDVRDRWSSSFLHEITDDETEPAFEDAREQVTEIPNSDEEDEEPTVFENAEEYLLLPR